MKRPKEKLTFDMPGSSVRIGFFSLHDADGNLLSCHDLSKSTNSGQPIELCGGDSLQITYHLNRRQRISDPEGARDSGGQWELVPAFSI